MNARRWLAIAIICVIWLGTIAVIVRGRAACRANRGTWSWAMTCERPPPGIIIQRDLQRG